MVAWYMLSKESYMKRVINDVLPTARVLARGGGAEVVRQVQAYRFVRREIPTCGGQSQHIAGFWAVREAGSSLELL